MRAPTEDLLEIPRLNARDETVDLAVRDLGPLASRVGSGSGPPTQVRIVRDAAAETDRRRLERVLGDLVANAHKHGAPPVVLTAEGPVVTVRDHGDGLPRYLLESGPQRFRTESRGKGHGLGLTIAMDSGGGDRRAAGPRRPGGRRARSAGPVDASGVRTVHRPLAGGTGPLTAHRHTKGT